MKYKSCVFIEKGLQFNYDSVSLCYQRSCQGGGYGQQKLIDNFKGHNLDLKKIDSFKKQLIENNKKGIFSPICEGCIELRENDWGGVFTGVISLFNLDYWTYCNCNCIYCYTHNKKDIFNTREKYNFLDVLKYLK